MIDVFWKLRLVANAVTQLSQEPISYLVLSTLITQYLTLSDKPTPQATFKYKIAENKRGTCTYYQQPNAPNRKNRLTAGWDHTIELLTLFRTFFSTMCSEN